MVVLPSTSAVATPEAVTDPGVETDLVPGVETDLVPEVETDLVPEVEINPEAVTNLVQVVVVTGPVPEQDQVQGRNPVQAQDRVRATRVPLVARARVEVLHRETVNEVHPVVLANQNQEAHPAEVVVDAAPVVVVVDAVAVVAEVAVDVDVDLKWR